MAASRWSCASTGSCWVTWTKGCSGTGVATSDNCGHAITSGACPADAPCTLGVCQAKAAPWLNGTWSRGTAQISSNYANYDDLSLTLTLPKSYAHKLSTNSPTTGTFTIAGDVVTFGGGALNGKTINLKTSFDSTCRILYGLGNDIWRKAEVSGCPTFAIVAAADCKYVGSYQKVEKSGSINGSGSGSETTYTSSVSLYRDRFYTYDSSKYSYTCYSGNCKSISTSTLTSVGQWSVAKGAWPYTLAALTGAGWTFKKSTAVCP